MDVISQRISGVYTTDKTSWVGIGKILIELTLEKTDGDIALHVEADNL